MTIRVFLLNGHESVCEGLRAVRERENDMEIAGEADTAIGGLARIEATRLDVVLADLMLSDGGGLDVCRRIKASTPGVVCLVPAAVRADTPGFLLTHTTS
ncbi:MAG: hypothetical protein CL433_06000 [Acidimicrobiaceae bacterium]|jgi:DNA-binding NarL/FixJ family response regulator|nr:hypothetical protein [Acidimicrobiaceae bacterium]HAB56971.1 hypothetical protein [Acidimicrobiaceae bacterium]